MPVPIAEQDPSSESLHADDDTLSATRQPHHQQLHHPHTSAPSAPAASSSFSSSFSPSTSRQTRTSSAAMSLSSSAVSASSSSSSSPSPSLLLAEWRPRVARIQREVHRLFSAEPPGDSQRKRELYRDSELARMDLCDEPAVAEYLSEHSHAASERRRVELEKGELGSAVHRLLAEFDEVRDAFSLKGTIPRPSAVALWVKMVVSVGYTLLSVIASLYLMPMRLLHPALRRVGVRNHFLPIDLVQKHYCRGFLYLCGVEVRWEGLDRVNYEQPVVGMFSHASNMDPMILASGPLAYKWIAKHSLFRIPLFGWTLAGWGHYPINRSNMESAKQSLAHAARSIHRYRRCLAVSPEGTRSKTGRLQDFKKGPFHTAITVDLPIVPVLIMGAYQLWPPNQLFPIGGEVVVRMLPAITRLPGEGYKELSGRVRRAMLSGIAEPVHSARVYTNSAVYVLWLPVTLALCWLTVRMGLRAFGL